MASGSSTQQPKTTSGAQPTSGSTGPFSWNGNKSPSTFDPKDLGTKIFGDVNTAYGQGPKINPVNPFTDYGADTKGLISGGLDALKPVANGGWLNGGNPYFEQQLKDTRSGVLDSLGDEFSSFGRFGGGSMVDTAVDRIAPAENAARSSNFETEYQRMLGAQGQALGLSGLNDSKAAEKTAADATMWDRNNNQNFNHLAQYLGLLRGGDSSTETNKPTSIWDILGNVANVAGAFL